jgi:glycosyl hydrolase family 113
VVAAVLACAIGTSGAGATDRFDGFNVIAAPAHPFGGPAARRALARAKRLGARAVAIIPFLWQASPASPDIGRGSDMPDAALRVAIRDAHVLGLAVMVKPHVWVPDSWAGAVAMRNEDDWRSWFAAYGRALGQIARVAADEQADAFAIGTELAGTTRRAEWLDLIATARAAYHGTLLYVAHNTDEAEAVPFWQKLDAIGVSLYPPLGADDDRAYRIAVMRREAERLDALAARTGRSVLVGEVGLRSARGAAAKPWESAEERAAVPDPLLQAEILADWLTALDRPAIHGVLVWRWFTDPDAGGPGDTDFTVQRKPAEGVLMCVWIAGCGRAHE